MEKKEEKKYYHFANKGEKMELSNTQLKAQKAERILTDFFSNHITLWKRQPYRDKEISSCQAWWGRRRKGRARKIFRAMKNILYDIDDQL